MIYVKTQVTKNSGNLFCCKILLHIKKKKINVILNFSNNLIALQKKYKEISFLPDNLKKGRNTMTNATKNSI